MSTANNRNEVFSPYRSKQKEVGAKVDCGRFCAGLALFTTKQPMGMPDTATNVFGIDGEQRNRGAELTLYGSPSRALRMLGAVTLLDAEQKRTSDGINDGKTVTGVPKAQANLGME